MSSHVSTVVWIDEDTSIYARVTHNGNPHLWLAIDMLGGESMPVIYLTEAAAARLSDALTRALIEVSP